MTGRRGQHLSQRVPEVSTGQVLKQSPGRQELARAFLGGREQKAICANSRGQKLFSHKFLSFPRVPKTTLPVSWTPSTVNTTALGTCPNLVTFETDSAVALSCWRIQVPCISALRIGTGQGVGQSAFRAGLEPTNALTTV